MEKLKDTNDTLCNLINIDEILGVNIPIVNTHT